MGEVTALGLSADEVLATTRAVRKRLDLSRPVPRQVLEECVELAVQAPSGSNRQSWHFVLVDDAEVKVRLAELYRRAFEDFYASGRSAQFPDGDPRAERRPKVQESAAYLTANLHRVPWLLVPCADGRLELGAPLVRQAGWWGSILPAVWSFMLAARERALGTAWTTMHLAYELEAAEVLGLDATKVTQIGLIPVAYTIGTDFRPASRLNPSSSLHWNHW